MPIIQWNDQYVCGIKTIDEHHQVLVELINQLHDAMRDGKGNQELGAILNRLVEYTTFHFNYEEKLMTQHAYPGLVAHRAAHANLAQEVKNYQAEFARQKMGLSVQVIHFLKDWLTNHILVDDRKYVPYLAAKGVK